VTPEELTARASRAFRAFQQATEAPPRPWASLSADEVRVWESVASAAHSYRPPNARQSTARHLNVVAQAEQIRSLADALLETLTPTE
jgi:hypothetical protein